MIITKRLRSHPEISDPLLPAQAHHNQDSRRRDHFSRLSDSSESIFRSKVGEALICNGNPQLPQSCGFHTSPHGDARRGSEIGKAPRHQRLQAHLVPSSRRHLSHLHRSAIVTTQSLRLQNGPCPKNSVGAVTSFPSESTASPTLPQANHPTHSKNVIRSLDLEKIPRFATDVRLGMEMQKEGDLDDISINTADILDIFQKKWDEDPEFDFGYFSPRNIYNAFYNTARLMGSGCGG